jgi:hypothetical protein
LIFDIKTFLVLTHAPPQLTTHDWLGHTLQADVLPVYRVSAELALAQMQHLPNTTQVQALAAAAKPSLEYVSG